MTVLVPKSRVKAPRLPAGTDWSAETRSWWRQLWALPQAAMWDRSGLSLWGAARIYDRIVTDGTSAPLEAELRRQLDGHGCSPKALEQLRWRVGVPADLEEDEVDGTVLDMARRRRLVKSLDGA